MPDARRASCRNCGRHRDEVGLLSWTGLCLDCGIALKNRQNVAMHFKTGPEFVHWRKQMAASVGGVLLDDLPSVAQTGR